jgi:hypothetical protein
MRNKLTGEIFCNRPLKRLKTVERIYNLAVWRTEMILMRKIIAVEYD